MLPSGHKKVFFKFRAPGRAGASSLDGVVEAGDDYVVVDGLSGGTGDYVLHVNAIHDGAARGPVAEPNYDEAAIAYNRPAE
jgi:hypothetical protein